MARVGALDGQRLSLYLEQEVHNRFERNVAHMRPLGVAPADVQPNAVGRNPAQGVVDGFDVLRNHAPIVLETLVPELGPIPAHRQARIVELNQQSGLDDRAILIGERIGGGEHVLFV